MLAFREHDETQALGARRGHRRGERSRRRQRYIEGSWLLVLSVLLGAATIWLVRHRAAEQP